MNKYQKALDELCSKAMVRVEDYDEEEYISWCEPLDGEQLAIFKEPLQELVDKATPKFITCKSGWQGTRYTRYRCPNCNKTLEFAEYPYCKHCGQAVKYPKLKKVDNKIELDWSEE